MELQLSFWMKRCRVACQMRAGPFLRWMREGELRALEGHVWTETLSRVPDIQISVTDAPLRFDANEKNLYTPDN